MLLHHPFDSYDAVVSFIESAAKDPLVLSIKQTLYRTSEHSLIVPSLIAAAEKKEVTAVVELKARFDEDSNIRWSRDLEDAGVQVFHGLVGLKTHCKMSLLVRHDPDGVTRRYAHLGTGNYNTSTARLYTDLSLLTARSGDHQRGARRFQFSHRLCRASQLRTPDGGAARPGGALPGADCARSRACAPRPARAHHRQDECAAR